ncbi:MAG: type II toxin-antitoxin system RelE/ParE family toxin [Microcystaceae cyanobacterium]
MFKVEFHPKAAKEAKELLRKNKNFSYQFREYLESLETQPYTYPKKKGKLRSCRAISFNIDGTTWRLIFRILETREVVEILSINTHDNAYKSAERRVD